MKKHIYVRKADEDLIVWLKAYATTEQTTQSEVIIKALKAMKKYLERQDKE